MRSKLLKNKMINRFFWIILLVLLWQAAAVSGLFNNLVFPSVPEIAGALYLSAANGEIIIETFFSIALIIAGLTIGIAGALVLSSLSMISRVFEGFVQTLTAIAHPLPGIALLPLIIIWFGTGTNSILFIIIHSVIWPLVLNIMSGFKSMPRIYREVGQNFGLGRLEIIKGIMIPASLPYMLAGIKIGWARAWRALIAAEMIFGAVGGKGGLGWYIFKQRVFMDTAGMFAGLAVIVVIGILVEDILFSKIEHVTVKKWGMVD